MGLVLLNLQSQKLIELDSQKPLIIGRKNIDECTDKRISRSHGKIACTEDGKIVLSALHSNPCFFTRNGVPPVLQLNKDEEQVLNVGDCLGLLPDSFWFQVAIKDDSFKANYGNNVKPSISESNELKTDNIIKRDNRLNMMEEVNKNSDLGKTNKNIQEIKNGSSSTNQLKDNAIRTSNSEPKAGPSSNISWGYGNPEFEKTRKLPLWMYQIDEPKVSEPSSKKTKFPISEKEPKKPKMMSEATCSIEAKDGVTQKSESCSVTVIDNNVLEMPSTSVFNVSSLLEESKHEKSENPKIKDGYESDVKEETNPCTSKRPICQYEGNCYRKNPQHKVDFSHPGDADYVPYENRPLCQYGAACYRRNEMHKVQFRHPPSSAADDVHSVSSSCSCPSPGEERPPCLAGSKCRRKSPGHRKQFYHPPRGYTCHFEQTIETESSEEEFGASSPLPPKRRRKKVKRHGVNSEDDEDDDGYDLEDPFINDASSDDYVPGNSEVDEESDAFDVGSDV